MEFYQILSLCGVTTLGGTIMGALISFVVTEFKENKALKKGLQALLRAQMINDYNKWATKGYAPIYARQNFQNCWDNYEALGENGVMNDIKNKFMSLPTPPAETI